MVKGIKKARKGVNIANISAAIRYFAHTDSVFNIRSPPKQNVFVMKSVTYLQMRVTYVFINWS